MNSTSLKQFQQDLLKKFPELERLDLFQSGSDIRLDTIIVKRQFRKSGIGSKVLKDIKSFADSNSKRVILTTGVKDSAWGTTSSSRLDKFYRRNGFVANKNRNKDFTITATHYYDGRQKIDGGVNESVDVASSLPLSVKNIHDTRKEIIATDTYKLDGKDTGYTIEVGKLILSKIDSEWRGTSLYVAESHRNKGLAFHLLKRAVKEVGPIKTSRVFSPGGLIQMKGLVRRGWADAQDNGDFLIHFTHGVNESVEHPMIEIGGRQYHRNNSLGKPIHASDEGIKNFYKWFGDSIMVDKLGRPLVLYHGTSSDFNSFSTSSSGIHLGTTKQAAVRISGRTGSNIIPVYVKIQNLYRSKDLGGAWESKIKSAKSTKCDGTVYLNRYEGIDLETIHKASDRNFNLDKRPDSAVKKFAPELEDSYIAFLPSQIKSAIGNNGNFNPNSTNITEMKHPYRPDANFENDYDIQEKRRKPKKKKREITEDKLEQRSSRVNFKNYLRDIKEQDLDEDY